MRIRVILADDHTLFREGLRRLLEEDCEVDVIGEACNGDELLALAKQQAPQVVVTDLSMPGRHGADLLKALRSHLPTLGILVVSMHPEDPFAVRMIKAGANGYLPKSNASTDLLTAIKKVATGGTFLTPSAAEQLALSMFRAGGDVAAHERLSTREYDVFLRLAQGQSVSAIADSLSLSGKTISTHKANILDKLQLENLAQLVRYALKHQLVD